MKRFLLSLVALVAFSATAFAIPGEGDDPRRPPPPLPDIVVETIDDSVSATLETAHQYVENAIQPIIWEVGPQADAVISDFYTMTMILDNQGIDTEAALEYHTELLALSNEAEENYTKGRKLFARGVVYFRLGDIFASEAEEAEGVVAYTLRTRAAAYYYRAATYIEQSHAALDIVLEIGEKARVLIEELTPGIFLDEDKVTVSST